MGKCSRCNYFQFQLKQNEVYYVVDHNGTADDHHVGSVQFFYSPDKRFYLVLRIRSLSLRFKRLDFACWVGETLEDAEWEMCNINKLFGKIL